VKEILERGEHDANGLNRWQVDGDPRGWRRTPLHAAAIQGHLELARYLLSEGADPNVRTKCGDTPLHVAVDSGHATLAALLREGGADLTIKDDRCNPCLPGIPAGCRGPVTRVRIPLGAPFDLFSGATMSAGAERRAIAVRGVIVSALSVQIILDGISGRFSLH
jgi:hypothetical protein